jgi:uncharacterized Zn-binding protein involved in type VI secretion
MSQPAAREGDRIKAQDNHLIQPPGPSSPVLKPHPFDGILDGNVSSDVFIGGKPAAMLGSKATNKPSHLPQGGSFVNLPLNLGRITGGSNSVYINGRPAARNGDAAETCADPMPNLQGKVVASGSSDVFIG